MSLEIPPFLILLAGGLLMPLVPRKLQATSFLVFPAVALGLVWNLPDGAMVAAQFYKYELTLLTVDALSRVFGIIFSFIVLAGGVYAFHIEENGERSAALFYGSGALGVTFAGDLLSLLLFWEIMAVASSYLVWARRTPESARAAMRYLLVHLFGGSLLMAGIVVHVQTTGGLELRAFAAGESMAAWLMLAGVATSAAIPPLHAWLSDSYPKASVTGAIFMSALTTKSAVYVLARMFPGWDILIYFGVAMALYGVVYAVLANDIREILAYHIISQVGYMVAGVGIGTALAINGTAAHAFSHILYKALLFMGAGAVIHATGKSKLTELGGLAKYMPLAVGLYMIGAFSISGFPLFNGFISKSIIVTAAGEEHLYAAKFLLMLASVGTFLHTGLKLPFFTWFGPESGVKPVRKVPVNMLCAMGLTAFLCTGFGVLPALLYRWLPFEMSYQPYTLPHLVEATQMLIFTFVGFWILRGKLAGERTLAVDTDWFYRKPAPLFRMIFVEGPSSVFALCQRQVDRISEAVARISKNPLTPWQNFRGSLNEYEVNKERSPLSRSVSLTVLVVVVVAVWASLHLADLRL